MPPPRKYVVRNCNRRCTVNVQNLPGRVGELVHGWYQDGNNDYEIIRKAAVLEVKLSHGAVSRHRKNHLVPWDQLEENVGKIDPIAGESNGDSPISPRVSDLEVVERIIAAGADSIAIRGMKISPEMTLRAIEMKYRLTQGSVFEGFLGAIGAINEEAIRDDELQTGVETVDAVRSGDEQSQADVEGSTI